MKYLYVLILTILAASGASSRAQTTTGTLRGQVTDPSGAMVTNATVAVVVPGGQTLSATTDRAGAYEIGNLAPGRYTVTGNAKGFATFVQTGVEVAAGQTVQLNIALEISVEKERVNVQEETPQVDTNPASNASAIVLSGKDLEALPDDPDELQSDLEALAGPSAGPNGGQIYIDGFTGGQLPPKSSIREIRINQNPFSAEYDKLGYGRIEIFTKPGTDKFHGQVSVEGNSSGLNTRNPFLGDAPQEPYDSVIYMGNIGGPINKKASFFFNVQRRNIDEIAVVNATVLDQNFNPQTFADSVPNPRHRTNFSPRLDYQLAPNNTLTARYQYYRDTQTNAGVGGFALPSAGYDTTSAEHTVQISDTQVFGTRVILETRFQYLHENNQQTPLSAEPAVNVAQEFIGGGSSAGVDNGHTNHYELQDYVSIASGKHFLKFGGRLRGVREVDTSGAGFNGSFSFPTLDAYIAAEKALAGGATETSGPSQFTLSGTSSGSVPTVSATMVDAGLYVQDDWRLRSNFTVSYGLRFETQNTIHDHGDFAPRAGFAWGIGGGGKTAAKTVLRGGFGMFYDRFGQDLILDTNRLNGTTQQQYVVSAQYPPQCVPPNCPTVDFFPLIPPVSQLPPSQTSTTIYQINSNLRAPYVIQSAVSVERQITKIANVTVSYLNSRGVHQFQSWNANAPLPGTPYSAGPKPLPNQGAIDQYASEGIFKQNQLITNFNVRAGAKLTLFGFYSLNYANSDVSGASSFPSDQYNLSADYGRASFDVRHRFLVGGSIGAPYGFRLSPFMIVNSGSPYNVGLGNNDVNNDLVFNDRPAFATGVGSCPSPTLACHYTLPAQPYTPVPVNYLTGPSHFTLNFRLAKTFGFGPEIGKKGASGDGGPGGPPPGGPGGGPRGGGGGGGFGGFGGPRGGGGPFGGTASNHRYNLTLSVNARNVLNRVNAANPIGDIFSTRFGQSTALAGGPFSSAAANRKIELQAMFSF